MTNLDELKEVALESFKRGARHFVEFHDDSALDELAEEVAWWFPDFPDDFPFDESSDPRAALSSLLTRAKEAETLAVQGAERHHAELADAEYHRSNAMVRAIEAEERVVALETTVKVCAVLASQDRDRYREVLEHIGSFDDRDATGDFDSGIKEAK